MVETVLLGGIALALAGVVQVSVGRAGRTWSPVAAIRQGLSQLEGSEAETLRAEFRRSVAPPERRPPHGFQ